MEIKNEEHAKEVLIELQNKPVSAQKREIRLAIEKLELSCMYYEQKGNERGCIRSQKSIKILSEHLKSIE